MSLLIKITELFLIFIIIRSFFKILHEKIEKKRDSSSQSKNERVPFDVKEQDIVEADYEEIE